MRIRVLLALIVLTAFSVAAIARAQRPERSKTKNPKVVATRQANNPAIVATRQQQGTVFALPRPPGMPTPEAIHAKIREDFLNQKYEGTRPQLDPALAGGTRALHTRLAEAFRAADFTPPQRVEHYAWVRRNPISDIAAGSEKSRKSRRPSKARWSRSGSSRCWIPCIEERPS